MLQFSLQRAARRDPHPLCLRFREESAHQTSGGAQKKGRVCRQKCVRFRAVRVIGKKEFSDEISRSFAHKMEKWHFHTKSGGHRSIREESTGITRIKGDYQIRAGACNKGRILFWSSRT